MTLVDIGHYNFLERMNDHTSDICSSGIHVEESLQMSLLKISLPCKKL